MLEAALITYIRSPAKLLDLQHRTDLGSYKNAYATKGNVASINNEVVLVGDPAKAIIHTYQLCKSDEELSCKIVLNGKPNAIASTPDGTFCVFAMNNELQVWNFASNLSFKCSKRHFQQINVVRCSPDNTFFISGGEDGMIVVWKLSQVFNKGEDGQVQPSTVITDHSLPVSDICFGKSIYRTLFCSVSLDRTCKVYDLKTNTMLVSVVFQIPLTKCEFSHTDSTLYLGSKKGSVFRLSISSTDSIIPEQFEESCKNLQKFSTGHVNKITAICVLWNDKNILTGSTDRNIIIWNLNGYPLHILHQPDDVTNILLFMIPKSSIEKEGNTIKTMKSFNRVKSKLNDKKLELEIGKVKNWCPEIFKETEEGNKASGSSNRQKIMELELENSKLKSCNAELFEYCKKIINQN